MANGAAKPVNIQQRLHSPRHDFGSVWLFIIIYGDILRQPKTRKHIHARRTHTHSISKQHENGSNGSVSDFRICEWSWTYKHLHRHHLQAEKVLLTFYCLDCRGAIVTVTVSQQLCDLCVCVCVYGVNRQPCRHSHHDDMSSFAIVDGDVNTEHEC